MQTKITKALMVMLSMALIFTACKKEDEVVPAPTVSAGTALSGVPGAKVTLTATISAPGGIKTVTVLKNGAAFDSKAYAGETSATYTKEYTVETLAAGTIVNFTIQVLDNSNQSSSLTTIPVTVTAVPPTPVVEVKGNLEGNVTWTADKIYKLVGFVRVGQEDVFGTITKTGVLTIEPGTRIIGDRATKGTLIVQRGSKIIANGTVEKPIVMTSERNPGEKEAGDWGGLVICGKAPNNLPDDKANRELEGGYGAFHGGSDAADNSGSLKYVRVEYAGIPINPNQEVNSFTFGSVGSGTTVDYVQASYGLDDSFEFFGGTVNCKHLIAYRGLDDDFDNDNGYSGYVQYAVGIRGTTQADQSGSNGFEVDNDANGSSNTPFTSAIWANVSIIGAKGKAETSINIQFQNGAQLRRNNKLKIYNTFITGYPNGVYIDSQRGSAKTNAEKGDIDLQNVVLAGVDGWGTNGWGQGFATNPKGFAVSDVEQNAALTPILIGTQKPSEWFVALKGNKILANTSKTGLSSTLWGTGTPTFTLTTGTAESLIGASLPATLPAFFDKTDFVGAFKDTDWTKTWAEFNPQSIQYLK
ncbi:Ig-like domain repeat protein [Emticicia sp. SJ17W-69]|uniref:Ig-like domain repeat protein n=1 Tax=Emticicia sp. SJ17W-69 TaxID=3421657 RepID=UPI003EBB5757